MTPSELLTLIYLRMIATGENSNPLQTMSGVLDDLKTSRFIIRSTDPRVFAGMSDAEIASVDNATAQSVADALAREEAEKTKPK